MSAALLALAGPAAAQEDAATAGVFRRFSDQVVEIEIAESGSGAKASMGSGFFIDADGRVLTNYHVVSQLVHEPDRYGGKLIGKLGETSPVEILAIDVVHDLAVLRSQIRPQRFFPLDVPAVTQGERLYSLGHPNDLGLSIVEGTYNGLLEHTLYPKIHFTGSLNPGMSGGPTIDQNGQVVGVNVSTAGNQVSFLVPMERAAALVRQTQAAGYRPPQKLLAQVADQIRAYQSAYLAEIFKGDTRMVELGPFRAATQPAPFFRCWGDAARNREQPYETVTHQCSTDDYLYIAEDQQAGVVELSHELVTSRTLNRRRFYSLYSSILQRDDTPGGAEEHVTSWRCAVRNMRNESARLRGVLCLRGYRKLNGLYDAVFKVAVLGAREAGLVSTLMLSGVTYESVNVVVGRYVERVAWR